MRTPRRRPTLVLALAGAAVLLPLGAGGAAATTRPLAADPVVLDAAAPVQPLRQAHAHNDYEHERPLLDALDRGFTSVEADVYLVDGQLLVAHDPEDLDPSRTLQSLYLEPLEDLAEAGGGSVHGDGEPVQLLIDVKGDAVATWLAIEDVLAQYPTTMTSFTMTDTGYDATPRAATAVISGNRPVDLMARDHLRWSAYDGRSGDLLNGSDPDFMPLVSDNWANQFTWRGEGEMPAAERSKLADFVTAAHLAGREVRFWNTPDTPGPARDAVWAELVAAQVDQINTDDLDGLRDFLLAQPQA
ncbi:phosphatidylinositol-specific phospholipase C/glycerophosphodiester phosphodiesterase family protein [Kineococcus sp. SYSU DK001]|uniref:phosphatidylinositol-specific phospholipase C/glycerophosphodiester phosphodiesterase family protein n=1 Tax=Kineococcus sp. SYSU DK001 TaxID=3383122 RepID=UPI003D7D4F74